MGSSEDKLQFEKSRVLAIYKFNISVRLYFFILHIYIQSQNVALCQVEGIE